MADRKLTILFRLVRLVLPSMRALPNITTSKTHLGKGLGAAHPRVSSQPAQGR